MNRILLSTSLALVLSGSLAFPQQQDTAPPLTAKRHAHMQNPQRETARLSKRLNLSSDQTAKLEPILADRDQKIAALKGDPTISPMIMKKQMHAIHQQTRHQLATVLTPDQLQQMRSQHRNHTTPAQTSPQAPPQTNPQSAL